MKFFNHGEPMKISLDGKLTTIDPGMNTILGYDSLILAVVQGKNDLSFEAAPVAKKAEPAPVEKKADPAPVATKAKETVKKRSR